MHVLEIIHCYWMVFKYQVCILSNDKYTLQAQNHVGYIALMLMFCIDPSIAQLVERETVVGVIKADISRSLVRIRFEGIFCQGSFILPQFPSGARISLSLQKVLQISNICSYIVFSFYMTASFNNSPYMCITTYLYIPSFITELQKLFLGKSKIHACKEKHKST